MATNQKNKVLEDVQMRRKIKRIAFEIYENNFSQKDIVMAGVFSRGYTFAKLLSQDLTQIAPIMVHLVKITLDKRAPAIDNVLIDCKQEMLAEKNVVIVDDVLNTGRTLFYSMMPLLSSQAKHIQVAVLVNRGGALYPIQPTYTGLELSTTLNEHVEVILEKKMVVYLS